MKYMATVWYRPWSIAVTAQTPVTSSWVMTGLERNLQRYRGAANPLSCPGNQTPDLCLLLLSSFLFCLWLHKLFATVCLSAEHQKMFSDDLKYSFFIFSTVRKRKAKLSTNMQCWFWIIPLPYALQFQNSTPLFLFDYCPSGNYCHSCAMLVIVKKLTLMLRLHILSLDE